MIAANVAPTSITLSTLQYVPPAFFNATIASLAASDVNSDEQFSFRIVGGADAAKFRISEGGNTLVANVISGSGLVGVNLQVTISVRDRGNATFVQSFTISEGCLVRFVSFFFSYALR